MRLRLRLRPAAESLIRAGHPWVFDASIRDQNRAGESGELAVIFDRNDRFLALGLYDPASPIRVRIIHRGKPAVIDREWWRARLRAAAARRAAVFDAQTNGGRWIHGESDGFPGLVLDRYADTLVLKLYSGLWFKTLDEIISVITEELRPAALILRLSRNIAEQAAALGFRNGQALTGSAPNAPIVFLESGLKFEADVVRGQKTGFFLDQRENRRRVGSLAANRTVLNAFSFSGGFSLYAARGGARSVTDIDISAHALESARRNFALNGGFPRCRQERVQADVFAWLRSAPKESFDLVILDPPSLARRHQDRAAALQAYFTLAERGLALTKPGGVTVCCSCSAHIRPEEFFETVQAAAKEARQNVTELSRTREPVDHPSGFPEAEYLKAIYLGKKHQ